MLDLVKLACSVGPNGTLDEALQDPKRYKKNKTTTKGENLEVVITIQKFVL